MKPTDEQTAILDSHVQRLSVVALAGTGKTSTLRLFAEQNPRKRLLYLAFNRAIADEVRGSFPKNVTAKTTHSLALSGLRGRYNGQIGTMRKDELAESLRLGYSKMQVRVRVARHIQDTMQHWFNSADERIAPAHLPKALKLPQEKRDIRDRHIDEKSILGYAHQAWALMAEPARDDVLIPHDGYLKAFCQSGVSLPYDVILLDEAQDTNPCVLGLLEQQQCRLCMIGDPYQSIYAWRGAVDAMQMPADQTLHLTGSFRFGPEIAAVGDHVLQWIDPNAPQLRGLGKPGRIDGIVKGHQLGVFGRTNEGLFDAAAKLILHRPQASIGFIGGIRSYGFDAMLEIFRLWSPDQTPEDPEFRRFETFEDLQDYAENAGDVQLSQRARLVETYNRRLPGIIDSLKKADAGPEAMNLFSTVHRAKGREVPQAVLCDDFSEMMNGAIPVDLAAEAKESANPSAVWENARLRYVACTRPRFALRPDREYTAYAAFMASQAN